MLPAPQDPSPTHGLFDSLYGALRSLARHYLRREQNAYSLSPTLLVHDAWIALARSQATQTADRDHYFRLMSRVMKNLLIDHARRKLAIIHGGGAQHVEWGAATVRGHRKELDQILAIASAMEQLAALSPDLAALVEMRYFGGFSEAEVAQILRVSIRTVRRRWTVARLHLLQFMQPAAPESSHYA